MGIFNQQEGSHASIVKKNDWYYIKWYDIEGKQFWRHTCTKNKREAKELASGLSQEVRIQRKNKSSMKSGNTEIDEIAPVNQLIVLPIA